MERRQSARGCFLQLEHLEKRLAPSINPAAPLELDGNVTTTTAHDWDQVFADAGSPTTSGTFTQGPTSKALAGSFVADKVNSTADDIFQGGGSKDTLGIQSGKWLFTGSKPQGKDDITHAYAAAYTDPSNGHLLLYAGLDRFDNSGDATAGFWFFQNQIVENPNVTTNGGHPFTGTHSDGDILLVSDFTIGGSTSTIKVFKWTGNDATGSLVALNSGNPIGGDTFAIVNGAPISVPWSYVNKRGATQPDAGEFLEEGVDLTALGLQGCFSTFLAETRSSQSPTATLSDFTLGSFPLCSIAPVQIAGLSKVGDDFRYDLQVQNTGAVKLFPQNVTDTLLGKLILNGVVQSPVSPVKSITVAGLSGDGSLAPNAILNVVVVRTVQAGDPDPTLSTTNWSFNDKANFTDTPITAQSTTDVNLFQPSATLTLTASPTSTSNPNQVITYTYTVHNTSSSDSPNLVLDSSNQGAGDPNTFTDSLLGDLEADAIHAATGNPTATMASIAAGAMFSFTKTRQIQSTDPNPLTNNATAVFTLAQNFGNFSNQIHAPASSTVTLLPQLTIAKKVTGNGTSAVIHPGDTASFTITVSNTGAGAASGIVVTDQLPEASLLTWSVTSSTFDSASISTSDFLTANKASLAAGASVSVTVSAVIPLTIFGNTGGTGNGDPIPLDLFELDGNAQTGVLGTSGSTTTSHDWDQVYADNQTNPPGTTSGAVASSFLTDKVNSNVDDIFQGGGSKDTLGIQSGQWLFTGSKPQGKDDIVHAFAATYTDSRTHDVILYAGLDRFDNSGDATAGFWFFQNAIGLNPNVTTNGGHPFTGTHKDGDILLVSDFTTGGSVSTIKVFKWTGDDATGSLVALNNGNPINGSTFAIVNSGSIPVPWSYTDKSKRTQPAAGEFLEEGVNLSALGLGGCFSSFLAETRSSQSPTATLSDFVLGSFNTCMLELPNTAHLHATNPAIDVDSNQVLITVTDGMPMLAPSIRNDSGTPGLTDPQLQAVVGQAIDQWRAAGVDPQRLAALQNQIIEVADLSHGELGWTHANHTWIDPTAQGWGWSLDGNLTQGKMDLLTVVTHELGHVLDMPYTATGVMELTLTPGMRLLPGAAQVAGTAALTSNTQVSQSGASSGQGIRGPEGLAGLVRDSSLSPRISPTVSFIQNSAIVPGSVVPGQTGPVIVNREAALTVAATSAPVDVSSLATPTVQSPAKRPENGTGYGGLFDADQEDATDSIDLLSDSAKAWGAGQDSTAAGARADASVGWRPILEAYFAQENWEDLFLGHTEALKSASEDSAFGEAALSPMLAAGLAVVLGRYVRAPAGRFTAHDRRRFQV